MKKKISFDFDNTLEHEYIQDYAKELANRGFEIHIVTSRYEDTNKYEWSIPKESENHSDLYLIADKLSIPDENVHFTNMKYKEIFFKNNTFLLHIDDNSSEVTAIDQTTKTNAVNVTLSDWKEVCELFIK